jgi:L-alanine-DL-glutamate epimerase-like enolase superfamily enzyme
MLSNRLTGKFTLPCSKGAIYVVETANAALNAKVLGVVLAQLLSCKLLQAIGVLRLQGKQVMDQTINKLESVKCV